jgi:DnaJ-class molecular chaperone
LFVTSAAEFFENAVALYESLLYNNNKTIEYCINTGMEGKIMNCSRCEGNGEQNCPQCGGAGYDEHGVACHHCHGDGCVSCSHCSGSGYLD